MMRDASGPSIGWPPRDSLPIAGNSRAVRSLDKAFEVQTEFAKQAFETFLAESRKIHELHSELATQRVVHLEGFVARITPTTFVLRDTYP